MAMVDGLLHSAPGQAARTSVTQPVNFAPGKRSFFAVIERPKLTARTLVADDYIRSRAEDERQAHLLSTGLGSRLELADSEYLPNYCWNGVLETFQRLFKQPDRHFQRPRDNWYEEQDEDLEKRREAISPENSSGPCIEFGLIAQLRSSRCRGFGFVNLAGKSVTYPGRIHLSMRSGFADASCIAHRRSYYGAEQLFVDLVIEYERMKFIYEQLSARRSALLGLGFEFDHLERVGPSKGDRMFYISRNHSTPIRSVSVQINDGIWDRGIMDARTA